MLNKFKVDGVEFAIDDGNPRTADIVCKGEGYQKENDIERIEWLKKQLRHYHYKFINKDGEIEE
jgi:hypothetical protein